MRVLRSILVPVMCVICCASSLDAAVDPIVQLAKLTASDGGSDDDFGYSIAISGNVVAVGGINNEVSVFVKPAGGWQNMTQTAILTPSTKVNGFGRAVAISGNVIIVGAPLANQDQGAAYAFLKPATGWHDMTETAMLVPSDGAPGDRFGNSVSVSGDTAIVGADEATVGGNLFEGAAYIFTPQASAQDSANPHAMTLTETAKLTASDAVAGSTFGSAVSIAGKVVAVGAQGGNAGAGEAYVFVKPQSGWTSMTQTAVLNPSDSGGNLGTAIATNGATVVAGAPLAASQGMGKGAIYVFVEPSDGWADITETAKLQSSALGPIGNSVVVDVTGHYVAAGAPQGAGNGNSSGQVSIFAKPADGWQNTSQANWEVFSSSGLRGDLLGSSISFSDKALVTGAPGAKVGNHISQGEAFVFGRN